MGALGSWRNWSAHLSDTQGVPSSSLGEPKRSVRGQKCNLIGVHKVGSIKETDYGKAFLFSVNARSTNERFRCKS